MPLINPRKWIFLFFAVMVAGSFGHAAGVGHTKAAPAAAKGTPLTEVQKYAVEQAFKANSVRKIIDPTPKAFECEDCKGPSIKDLEAIDCNADNSYLEPELQALTQSRSEVWREVFSNDPSTDVIVKPVCIRMSMVASKFGATKAVHAYCGPGANSPSKRTVRACISPNYLKMTINSFNLVANCMKDFISPSVQYTEQRKDMLSLFAMINIESGFHFNSYSPSGAGGFGQLTQDYIEDTNKNAIPSLRTYLGNHNDHICRALNTEILAKDMISSDKYTCDRISISKGNPLKNMIYTFANMEINKQAIKEDIFDDPRMNKKFALLKESEKDEILRSLAVWAHNAGLNGVTSPLEKMLNIEYRKKPVTDAKSFIKNMREYMRYSPSSGNRHREVLKVGKKKIVIDRPKETSKYFPDISEGLQDLEKDAGGGSCLN